MYRNWFYFRKTCSINKLRWKHVPDIFSCHLSDEKDGKPFWRCLDGGAKWLWGIAAGSLCWSFPGCSYFLGSNAMELLTCFSSYSSPVLGVCWREQERWIQNGIRSVSAFWSGDPEYFSAINRPFRRHKLVFSTPFKILGPTPLLCSTSERDCRTGGQRRKIFS